MRGQLPDSSKIIKVPKTNKVCALGNLIQPDFYFFPILPIVLGNGVFRLALGWKCKIKQHNPRVLIEKTRNRLTGKDDLLTLTLWFKGTAMSEKGQIFAVKMPNGTVQTFASVGALYDAWYEARMGIFCSRSTEQEKKEKWLEQLDALQSKLPDRKKQHKHEQQQLQQPPLSPLSFKKTSRFHFLVKCMKTITIMVVKGMRKKTSSSGQLQL